MSSSESKVHASSGDVSHVVISSGSALDAVDSRLLTPSEEVVKPPEHQSLWLWVMCLTGVDYFSTLGYQPSIAFEAVGMLAPLATILLVGVTLGCALPVYSYVAGESPLGQGSISMLERLLSGWTAKFLVLVLLGFAATDYVITQTLSAADAAEHLVHNPLWNEMPRMFHDGMLITMFLLVMLGAMFMRGFREVIAVAVVLVGVYLLLNAIVIGSGLSYLAAHPNRFAEWYQNLQTGNWYTEYSGRGWLAVGISCVLFFPKLALGLSGFETGVAVMPLVKGDPDDDAQRPVGRIRNTRKLLAMAAIIMSVMLLGSSIVTTMLVEPEALIVDGDKEGPAANRALAYIAHGETQETGTLINPMFGELFGTIYDISTVLILWFAGADRNVWFTEPGAAILAALRHGTTMDRSDSGVGRRLYGNQSGCDVDL